MTYYRTDVPDTASEVFDGEVVIAHYGTGLYYSVSRSGALIWQALRHGLSAVEATDWLAGHFPAAAPGLQAQVEAFVGTLKDKGLVVEVEARDRAGELPEVAAGPWQEPTLDSFDDLQELLLLDPVHDVTEAGWPHRPDDPA